MRAGVTVTAASTVCARRWVGSEAGQIGRRAQSRRSDMRTTCRKSSPTASEPLLGSSASPNAADEHVGKERGANDVGKYYFGVARGHTRRAVQVESSDMVGSVRPDENEGTGGEMENGGVGLPGARVGVRHGARDDDRGDAPRTAGV
jgi:hypothetical protein